MRITIEETMDDGAVLKSITEDPRDGTFDDLVNLFRMACLGAGYAPETVNTLETNGDLLRRIQELEGVNETLRGQLYSK
jgi:hypothetical protein